MPTARSWDVFCRVVDNFGDAAVCWRLAHGLAHQSGAGGRNVRLWIDDLAPLYAMHPGLSPDQAQQDYAGVAVCRLSAGTDFDAPADIAVDVFGGGLPAAYESALAARSGSHLCVVLEYLSAESWVGGHHGLPSPHPRLPLDRYFFFPGFSSGTGGLLREADLSQRREAFLRQPAALETLWRGAGFAPPQPDATVVTLFGYENAAVETLLAIWSASPQSIVAALPFSRLSQQIAVQMGVRPPVAAAAGAGSPGSVTRGALELRFMPFLAQNDYDRLLWSADWNFVRGEDSFVRAQWAERPMLWQVYPQAEGTHWRKLDAFLGRYCRDMPVNLAAALRTVSYAWNGAPAISPLVLAEAVQRLAVAGVALRQHARSWAAEMADLGDLVGNLTQFCAERLK